MKNRISKITCCSLSLFICLGFAPGQTSNLNMNKEPVTVTFAGIDNYEKARYQPFMDAFNRENPGITVQFVAYSDSPNNIQSDEDRFRMISSSGDTAVVSAYAYKYSEYFQDLQPLIEADPTFKPDDFWPDELTACQDPQGRIKGVPMNLNIFGIFYDQAAFSEAKIPVPRPGWTWDDFRQAANALTRKTGDIARFGYGDPPYASILRPLIAAGINKNDGKLDIEKLSRDLQWYVDLARDGKIYPTEDGGYLYKSDEAGITAEKRWAKMFIEKQPPAMWTGSLRDPIPGLKFMASAGMSEEYNPQTHLAISEFGLAPFPIESDGSSSNTTPLSVECASMSAASAHPREALLWLNFLSRQWFMFDKSLPSEVTNIPARPSVAEKVGFWNTLPAGAEPAVRYGLDHAFFRYTDSDTMLEVYGALGNAMAGKSSLITALKDANTRIAPESGLDLDQKPSEAAAPKPAP